MKILVTGANGYIGGRLVPRLLESGHKVRVMVRGANRVAGFPWANKVEVHVGDVEDPDSLEGCIKGIDAAYYLIHGMGDSKDFRARDLQAATNFAVAAKGLKHLIYLGGLQPDGEAKDHLASRAEVGAELARLLPTTEFRAGPVIGSGSASFEMTRYLTERLPVMVTPRWVDNAVRPIAVRDILAYLEAGLKTGPQGIVDVGGTPLPFRQMMLQYAAARGLKRRIYKVPVLAPTLAARWVQFITPITNRIAVPLLAGIVHPVVGDTAKASKLFPEITPIDYPEAVALAVERSDIGDVETRWSGAHHSASYELTDWENMKREVRSRHVDARPDEVYRAVASLGGASGWPAYNWAWRLRGGFDRLIGGPGLRRGRRDAKSLRPGDAVDFWRVEALEPGRIVLLRAEMKLPGRAWLEFMMEPEGEGTRLIQTAYFEPRGMPGWLYWNLLLPFHTLIFKALPRGIARRTSQSS